MKYLAILCMLLLVACANETETKSSESVVAEFTTIVIPEETIEEQKETVKEFTVRAMENGFVPDTLEVNVGDHVTIHVTNDLLDEDARAGIDMDDASRFGISGYNVESFYHDGGVLTIEFTADKKGVFDFGDESRNVRKGRIHVK